MSVINQMLKDLEQRTPEQGQNAVPVVNNQKTSTIKIVLISLAVLITLNILGFYIWDLQKQVTISEQKVKQHLSEQSEVTPKKQEPIQKLPQPLGEALATNQQEVQPEEVKPVPSLASKAEVKPQTELAQELTPQEKIISVEQAQVLDTTLKNKTKATELVAAQAVLEEKRDTSITPIARVNVPTESKMTVSRRQLTAKELVSQKLARAEKAIKNNDIVKAEKLFEETLIIDPNNKQARKKLAALWFGRKSYQQAINLLSQGISLDRNDAELRMLKAKIYLQQGQNQAAYNTLKPLPMLKQQDYQVMLANVAQQIEQYESAIQAYKVLIDMQSYSGRWHLGLAIIYDKNSQFSLAATEYATALTKSDLSIASAKFAQQRMQALGE